MILVRGRVARSARRLVIHLPQGKVAGTIYSVNATGPLPCKVTSPTALTAAVSNMETTYTDGPDERTPLLSTWESDKSAV